MDARNLDAAEVATEEVAPGPRALIGPATGVLVLIGPATGALLLRGPATGPNLLIGPAAGTPTEPDRSPGAVEGASTHVVTPAARRAISRPWHTRDRRSAVHEEPIREEGKGMWHLSWRRREYRIGLAVRALSTTCDVRKFLTVCQRGGLAPVQVSFAAATQHFAAAVRPFSGNLEFRSSAIHLDL
jgi:hypothetical protein